MFRCIVMHSVAGAEAQRWKGEGKCAILRVKNQGPDNRVCYRGRYGFGRKNAHAQWAVEVTFATRYEIASLIP